MRWEVRSEKSLYADEWIDLRVADVELPGGKHLEHRLIRRPPSAGAVLIDGHGRALLIWRHRFITGMWGWEMPMGKVDHGETPVQAAAREAEEETGWRAARLRLLALVQPSAGIMDAPHYLFAGEDALKTGDPLDDFESERVEWIPLADVPALIAKREIVSANTIAALLYLLTEQSR